MTRESSLENEPNSEQPEYGFGLEDIDVLAVDLSPDEERIFTIGVVSEQEKIVRGLSLKIIRNDLGTFFRVDNEKTPIESDSVLTPEAVDSSHEESFVRLERVNSHPNVSQYEEAYGVDRQEFARKKSAKTGVFFDESGNEYLPSLETLRIAAERPESVVTIVESGDIDFKVYVDTVAETGKLPIGVMNAYYVKHDLLSEHVGPLVSTDNKPELMTRFMQPFAQSYVGHIGRDDYYETLKKGMDQHFGKRHMGAEVILDFATTVVEGYMRQSDSSSRNGQKALTLATGFIWEAIEKSGIKGPNTFESEDLVRSWLEATYGRTEPSHSNKDGTQAKAPQSTAATRRL